MKIDKLRALLEANQQRQKKDDSVESAKEAKKPAGKADRTPASSESNPGQVDLPPIKGAKTLSGKQANKVDIEPPLYPPELKEGKTAVVAFGRMNPPTIGHERLVSVVESLAIQHGATPLVYLSHSHDAKKNPLVYETKLAYAQYAFGDTIVESDANDLIAIATEVAESFDNIIFVCGSDRVAEYDRKLNYYNGDIYEYAHIVVESLSRDVSGDLVEAVSSSAARLLATSSDFASFKNCLATPLRYFAEEIYAEVRGELNELDTRQRAKRAILFARNKTRVQAGIRRARARRAPSAALGKRSRRLAIKNMRKRILRGQKYESLSYAQRATVDKRLKKRKTSISRLAKRLLPKVARAEAARKIGGQFLGTSRSLKESADLLLQFIPEAEYDYELSEKEVKALEEKAFDHATSYDLLETVFRRGVAMWENIETDMSFSQYGFGRVNSFLHGGKAYEADFDLVVEDCEEYASTTDDEEDINGDGKIEGAEREKIDARTAERKITTGQVPNGHKRVSVINRTDATPGKPKHQELLKKIFEARQDVTLKDGIPNIESGAGKRRVDLPQLTNFDAFHKDLSDAGHSLVHDYVTPSTLTPTQKHFNQEKVDRLKENGWGDKGIIISADDYVIDGHHRWLAAHQKGVKIKARRTSLNCDELLDFCKDKPYIETKKLNESRHSITDNQGNGYHGKIDMKLHIEKPKPVKNKKPGAPKPEKPDEDAERAKKYSEMHKLVQTTTGADAKTAKHYLDSGHGAALAAIHNDTKLRGLSQSHVTKHIEGSFAAFKKHYKPDLFESVKRLVSENTSSADKKPILTTVNGKKMFVMRTRKADVADAGGKDAEDESTNKN